MERCGEVAGHGIEAELGDGRKPGRGFISRSRSGVVDWVEEEMSGEKR